MSTHMSRPPESSKTELEIVVNWRMIALAAALAGGLAVVAVIGFLCFGGQPAEPAARPLVAEYVRPVVPSPRADSPRIRFDPATVALRDAPAPPSVEIPESVPPPSAVSEARPRQKPVVQVRNETAEAVRVEPPLIAATAPTSARKSKRLHNPYEFELVRHLDYVPELDLKPALKTALLAARLENGRGRDATAAATTPEPKHAILELAAKQADLQGLPLRQAKDCQKEKDSAQVMQALSGYFRRLDGSAARRGGRTVSLSNDLIENSRLVEILQSKNLAKDVKNGLRPSAAKDFKWDGKFGAEELALLVQMLQVKGSPVRLQLVKMLDACKEPASSVLIAQRALFDLDSDVRDAAVTALNKRPRSQYRQVFLDGLRHPWPPVAAHAAEALAALQDIDAAPQLVDLLEQPDPCAPFRDAKDRWVVNEMVGINHLRNCVLCHAASHDAADPGRSPVPKPGKPLPVVYYDRVEGDAVRADVTYLRQDFSALRWVEQPDKWPHVQRFDYVVRTRELTATEVNECLADRAGRDPADYPQRLAVLFALRELTAEDAGQSSADWRRLIGKAGLDDSSQ